jgi:hypothetical protein
MSKAQKLWVGIALLLCLLAMQRAEASDLSELCKIIRREVLKAPSSAAIELADELLRDAGHIGSSVILCNLIEDLQKGKKQNE